MGFSKRDYIILLRLLSIRSYSCIMSYGTFDSKSVYL